MSAWKKGAVGVALFAAIHSITGCAPTMPGFGNSHRDTQPPPQPRFTIEGTSCPNNAVNYYPAANKAFGVCGDTGEEFRRFGNTLSRTGTYYLGDPRAKQAFDRQIDMANRAQANADRAALRGIKQNNDSPLDSYNKKVRKTRGAVSNSAGFVRSLEQGANTVIRALGLD